jgi:hypothetical protein
MDRETRQDGLLVFFITFSFVISLNLLLEAFTPDYPKNEILTMLQEHNKEK